LSISKRLVERRPVSLFSRTRILKLRMGMVKQNRTLLSPKKCSKPHLVKMCTTMREGAAAGAACRAGWRGVEAELPLETGSSAHPCRFPNDLLVSLIHFMEQVRMSARARKTNSGLCSPALPQVSTAPPRPTDQRPWPFHMCPPPPVIARGNGYLVLLGPPKSDANAKCDIGPAGAEVVVDKSSEAVERTPSTYPSMP
jgi:hypothetical protein